MLLAQKKWTLKVRFFCFKWESRINPNFKMPNIFSALIWWRDQNLKVDCYFKNFLNPNFLVGIQTAKDRRWLKKKNIAHFNRYLQAFEHASFDSFVVAVSEVMACHVNFDFSVCGQGYFHRKTTIVFKFSRFLNSIRSSGSYV